MEAACEAELAEYLNALERERWYRVEQVLKRSAFERTELVHYPAPGGKGELGPFVRKYIALSGMGGSAYEDLFAAQRQGICLPQVPQVVECYRTEEHLVVVTRFVEGLTLQAYLSQWGPSAKLAYELFPSLCDAVIQLHEGLPQPIIHRDLKPSNIVVGREGVCLIDLGIARTYKAGARRDTEFLGTREFAPPEQFGFGQTDVRTDVYALGMLLRSMVAGVESDVAKRRDVRPEGVGVKLWKVILKATSFDPKDRYGSVRELKAAAISALQRDAKVGIVDLSGALEPTRQVMAGMAWDAFMLLLAIMSILVGTSCVFDPNEQQQAYPLIIRMVEFYGMFTVPAVLLCFGFADKRMLRSVVPRMGLSTRRRELIRSLALAAAVFCVSMAIGMAYVSMA